MEPWANYERASCYPDTCNCETIGKGWVVQPFATVSSIFYLLLAYAFYRSIHRKGLELTLWSITFFVLGIGSIITHATMIRYAAAVDMASIIMIISFFPFYRVASSLLREGGVIIAWVLYYVLLWLSFTYVPKYFSIAIILIVFTFSIVDLIRHHSLGPFRSKTLRRSLILIFSSFALYLLDELRIVCEPDGYLHGHTIWHLGSAVSIYLYGKWHFSERTAGQKEILL